MENKDVILSTVRNLKYYIIDYRDKKVTNELDSNLNTIFLSTVNTNDSIYI